MTAIILPLKIETLNKHQTPLSLGQFSTWTCCLAILKGSHEHKSQNWLYFFQYFMNGKVMLYLFTVNLCTSHRVKFVSILDIFQSIILLPLQGLSNYKVIFSFLGYTNQIAECYDKMKYPLTERYPCPCTHYTPAPLDNWSDCMLESKVADDITATIKPKDYVIKVPSKEDYCGIGRRIQIIVCQGNNNNNASAAICGQKGESANFKDSLNWLSGVKDIFFLWSLKCLPVSRG